MIFCDFAEAFWGTFRGFFSKFCLVLLVVWVILLRPFFRMFFFFFSAVFPRLDIFLGILPRVFECCSFCEGDHCSKVFLRFL